MSEKLWCLKGCSLFERLSSAELARLEVHSRIRTFPAGSMISLPGADDQFVFLLAEGLAKICHHTPDGKESILSLVAPGELFGELAILDNDKDREECVKSVERATVVMIPTEQVRRLMAEDADVSLGFTKIVGLRRRRIERRLSNLLFHSNRDRLIHLLLDLAEQFGREADNGIRLRVRLSHQDLANLIGSTRETVTILLGRLRAEGSVAGGRCRIVLKNPERLARCVHRQLPGQDYSHNTFAPSLVAG